MSKLRYLYDNNFDRGTLTWTGGSAGYSGETVTVAGSVVTVGGETVVIGGSGAGTETLAVANARYDTRGQVWRFTGEGSVRVSWPGLEQVGVVAIPASNLAPGSTIRVRSFSNENGTGLLEDTGIQSALYGQVYGPRVSSVNSFTDGSCPMVIAYLPTRHSARSLLITITNPNSAFTDIARIVSGGYEETTYTADWGASVGTTDMSTNSRSEAGDLRTDRGPRYNTMQFDLTGLTEAERAPMRHVLSGGVSNWLLFHLLAEHEDQALSRAYSIYGKPAQSGVMSYRAYRTHATQLQIDGF